MLVLTGSDVAQLRWSRPTRYHYAKPLSLRQQRATPITRIRNAYNTTFRTIAVFDTFWDSVDFKVTVFWTSYNSTRSSAVAERPRDASCLSVVSFFASIVQYLERSFLLLVTSASDLLVHTVRFCSVVFGVTWSLAVIHTIYRDCV